ncbi:MAG: hypothetical protein K0R63_662 [Rickettsiales bacterium]|jgi:CRP-like cAMP-binding protein|nr:hypothetical protein [Rickettsiales bacterium]
MINDLEAKKFKPGEYIFKEGDPSCDVYLINQGEVEITKEKNGKTIVLAKRGFNEIIGEMALVLESNERSASAKAVKDTWCYVLTEDMFRERLDKLDPFMQGIVKSLVMNLRLMNERHTSLQTAVDTHGSGGEGGPKTYY